ncbi:MAG TPA: pyridoxal-dependent decarboxylase [Oligoflexia bacterium]|nr:pyridoxal-dependent decarboxylase [Oligoflexia bacterium]HMP27075.1 pyridoxal-dependent decarboxylase [Oligoflexia bacterium]
MTVSQANSLIERHGTLSSDGIGPLAAILKIVTDFLPGIPLWASPNLHYNVCAPVNVASAAIRCIADFFNIHNIHTGFAGQCLAAERAVTSMMAEMAKIPRNQARGIFTFGGTGSNMYGIKLAINKVAPQAPKKGVPQYTNYFITTESHFSHETSADWLGIGTDQLHKIACDFDRRSNVADFISKAEYLLKQGQNIAGITLNGGTTYDHAIDDVKSFCQARDYLVKKYSLTYSPHIHVDSVIGWVWLAFQGYDFVANSLQIKSSIIKILEEQYKRVSTISEADSWGVDFHKALGGCSVPSGMFISNHATDLMLLSKSRRGVADTHQLGGDWALDDPSDITLETSRPAAPALAALVALQTLGKSGIRRLVANQVEMSIAFRELIDATPFFLTGNPHSLGFCTLVVMPPINMIRPQSWRDFFARACNDEHFRHRANSTVKDFYQFCATIQSDETTPLGASFSRSFVKTDTEKPISALKYYFVSPHIDRLAVIRELRKMLRQAEQFYISRVPLR